ncbi:hypothetical protein BVL33_07905 [Acinetobacter junii]|nr:hypothetical protein BVL33_07905 [Acinetobacter junii]
MTNDELQIWRAYRDKRGSLFVGRRVEQAIGNLIAFCHNGKVKQEHWIEPFDVCPHEDVVEVETTFEEEALKRRNKSS